MEVHACFHFTNALLDNTLKFTLTLADVQAATSSASRRKCTRCCAWCNFWPRSADLSMRSCQRSFIPSNRVWKEPCRLGQTTKFLFSVLRSPTDQLQPNVVGVERLYWHKWSRKVKCFDKTSRERGQKSGRIFKHINFLNWDKWDIAED